MPWLNGILDGINASNLIRASTIEHKNRFAFILLDSTLEITFKNFLNKQGVIIFAAYYDHFQVEKLKKHFILNDAMYNYIFPPLCSPYEMNVTFRDLMGGLIALLRLKR